MFSWYVVIWAIWWRSEVCKKFQLETHSEFPTVEPDSLESWWARPTSFPICRSLWLRSGSMRPFERKDIDSLISFNQIISSVRGLRLGGKDLRTVSRCVELGPVSFDAWQFPTKWLVWWSKIAQNDVKKEGWDWKQFELFSMLVGFGLLVFHVL